MPARSTTHGSFTIERTLKAPLAAVFQAFADREAKQKWFGGPPDWDHLGYELDFRVGGHESDRGGPKGGWVSAFYATDYDIVPDERIVYAYEMYLDDARISVSLASFEFHAEGTGTRLVMIEDGIYLDGYDDAGKRKEGSRWLIGALAASLGE